MGAIREVAPRLRAWDEEVTIVGTFRGAPNTALVVRKDYSITINGENAKEPVTLSTVSGYSEMDTASVGDVFGQLMALIRRNSEGGEKRDMNYEVSYKNRHNGAVFAIEQKSKKGTTFVRLPITYAQLQKLRQDELDVGAD